METYIIVHPTEKTVRTNILINLIKERNLKGKETTLDDIKEIIQKLENTHFDLTKNTFTFEDLHYTIVHKKEKII